MQPFHLAFPVKDIDQTRQFFTEQLNCTVGRESDRWIDFNFYGHQISAHLVEDMDQVQGNDVDDKVVPARHFGIVLNMADWKQLRDRFLEAKLDFVIEPYIRFEGKPGEQATMFIREPSGNCLEFKAFNDMSYLFAEQ